MMYVGSWARLVAFTITCLSLISCQQRLDLEAGLPAASAYSVSATTEFPGVVMVSIPGGGICTGTIVSHKAVLTAAHCTKKSGNYRVRGNFGAEQITSDRLNFGPGVVEDPNDISLLIFADNTFSENHVVRIADAVSSGETATLVGYGCNSLVTESGAGVKRAGTNVVARVNSYVEFYTPASSSSSKVRGILGPSNRAGSCFGDSGGPALKMVNGEYQIVAVTHAGGIVDNTIISQYSDISNRSDNRGFIADANRTRNLGIEGF
ncbi:hypothetical protein EBR03_01340 [bacterium]|nr:hypothetical protein [bacterium]